jgi:hypothetical protein
MAFLRRLAMRPTVYRRKRVEIAAKTGQEPGNEVRKELVV